MTDSGASRDECAPKQEGSLIIRPTRGWGRLQLGELWDYRELIWFLTWRNIKARYRQMALGPLWIVIEPIIHAVVFSMVFGRLAQLPSLDVPYLLFTYTALLPWTFFSKAAVSSAGSLVNQMQVISKVYFPRLVVPLSAVIAGLVDLAISFFILGAMMLFYGFAPSPDAFFLPLFIVLATASALALGLWTATATVRFRDVRFVVSHGMRVVMYATPVAYSMEIVPESWLWIYRLNPLYWVVEGFRWSLLGAGERPEPYMLIPVAIVTIALLTGAFIFRRAERTIVDLL